MNNFAKAISICLFFGITFGNSEAWSGHVCNHIDTEKQTTEECVLYSTRCTPIQAEYNCCEWRNITRYNVITQEACCEGWIESAPGNQHCDESMCGGCAHSQVCTSNGTCERECSSSGDSYPACYPGTCGSGHCTCADGFTGSHCQYISIKPTVMNLQLHLSRKIKPLNKTTFSSKKYLAHGTTWINTYGFNVIQLDWDVIFPLPELPPLPSSMNSTSFYIRFMSASLNAQDNNNSSYFSDTHTQYGSSKLHEKVSVSFLDFDRDVGHGNRFHIKLVTAPYGTYRQSNGVRRTYGSSATTVSYTVGFDFDPPLHSNAEVALVIQPEFSKGPVTISWRGWIDSMSGIDSYHLDVYLLYKDGNGTLRQPQHSIASYVRSKSVTSLKYSPRVAGVYSYVLKIVDMAGNFEYARRYGIFDPHSQIELSKTSSLYVASAAEESGYKWQNNTNGIIVNFKDHFRNKVQDSGGFLHKISTEPERGFFDFSVKQKYDDRRLANYNQNVHGIVLYQYIGGRIKENNRFSETDWKNISESQMMSETFTIMESNKDGDSYTIWMRAFDIMGNIATDNVTVYFDQTNPNYSVKRKIRVFKNMDGKYKTSVSVRVYDRDSGILKIKWEVVNKANGSVLATGYIPGNKTSKALCDGLPGDCDCIDEGSCFYYDHTFFVDHCQILLPKTSLVTTNVDLRIKALNGAALTREQMIHIGAVTDLEGINSYPKPVGTTVKSISQSGVRIDWQYAPSCYSQTGISVWYKSPSGEKKKLKLLSNATSLSVEGLDPGISYIFEFIVQYGDQFSDVFEYSVMTAEEKPPVSYVAGLVLEGMAIFVLLLGGLFCYCRRQSAPVDSFQNLESSVRMSDLTKRTEPKSKRQLPDVKMEYEPDQKPSCFSNTQGGSSQPTDDTQMAYDDTLCKGVDTEDNIYEDLSDALSSRHKNITREMVKLDAMLHDGQFGIVFAGTLHKGNNVDLPVAIRCPKVTDTSETTVLEFEAKIKEVLSVASSIGRHDNLLRYIDAIVDGSDPPMLLMEHCHLGCVRTWLEEQQESLLRREDLISVLHNIGLGVALGMEYLEKKMICHCGLNSYEILLSKDFIPKIKNYTGFGNTKNNNFLKWTAPEVLQTQQSNISADVWAYGVILWELFQIDKLPYSDVTDEQYLEYLNDGNRMEIPDNCEERHANVMDQAWQLDPQDRPAFSEIVTTLMDDGLSGSHIYSNERGSHLQTFS